MLKQQYFTLNLKICYIKNYGKIANKLIAISTVSLVINVLGVLFV